MVAPHHNRASGHQSGNALSLHLIFYLPAVAANWAALNLKNALIIKVVLAVFNLFPLPPLMRDALSRVASQRISQKICPSWPLWTDDSYRTLDCVALAGSQFGVGLGFVSHLISVATNAGVQIILQLTAILDFARQKGKVHCLIQVKDPLVDSLFYYQHRRRFGSWELRFLRCEKRADASGSVSRNAHFK
jgi:hypothetical protein